MCRRELSRKECEAHLIDKACTVELESSSIIVRYQLSVPYFIVTNYISVRLRFLSMWIANDNFYQFHVRDLLILKFFYRLYSFVIYD